MVRIFICSVTIKTSLLRCYPLHTQYQSHIPGSFLRLEERVAEYDG